MESYLEWIDIYGLTCIVRYGVKWKNQVAEQYEK